MRIIFFNCLEKIRFISAKLILAVTLLCQIDSYSQSYVFAQIQGSPANINGWNLYGAASVGNIILTGNSEIVVCPLQFFTTGAVFYNRPINLSVCNKWIAEFDFRIFDGTSADGLAFCFLDVPPSGFVTGGGMGIPNTANGLKICFDPNPNCFPLNFAIYPKIEIRWGIGYDECWIQPTVSNTAGSLSFIRSNTYNRAKIVYDAGNISVYVNNTLYLTGFQQFNFTGYLGFTAATGAKNDNHSIKNVIIYTDMPPSEAGNNQTICSGNTSQIGTSSIPGYLYNWSPSAGLSSTNISNPQVNIVNNTTNDIIQKYYVQTSFSAAPGCVSIDSVLVVVKKQATINNFMATICSGSSYVLPWGLTVNIPGIYRDTIRGAAGCDSLIRIVNLNAQNVIATNNNAFICPGQSYTLPWGPTVNIAGIYRDTLRYTSGCDSLIRVVNLAVQSATIYNVNTAICSGQNYILPWGTVVSAPGIYRDTLRYISGCDSLIRIINLMVQTVAQTNSSVSICSGQNYILPWGTSVNTAGIYRDTLRSILGCDSLFRSINITVRPVISTIGAANICSGQTYTLPWGVIVNSPGSYRDTITYVSGCDSLIRIVNLTSQNSISNTTSAYICAGHSYTLPWGAFANTAGIYRDTIKYISGCDSMVRSVNLTIQNVARVILNKSICPGQTYTLPSGQIINASGVYIDTLRSRLAGCDSIITTLTLDTNSKPVITLSKSNDINCNLGISKLNASGGIRYEWSPSSSLSNTTVPNPIANPVVTTFYYVKVTGTDGCIAGDSIIVIVNTNFSGNSFKLPNAFTPNNDGLNDCFGLKDWGKVTEMELSIYNRAGGLVFHTKNPSECWDGKYKGVLQPAAVYVYQVNAKTICGPLYRKGIVALVK